MDMLLMVASVDSAKSTALLEIAAQVDPEAAPFEVRWSVAHALSSLKSSAATPLVIPYFLDPDPNVRALVAQSYGFRLKTLSDMDVFVLSQLSDDEDGDVRNWALFSLAQMSDLDSVEIRDIFLRHLNDSEDSVVGEAAVGLAKRGDHAVTETLISRLSGPIVDLPFVHAAAYLASPVLLPNLFGLREQGWEFNNTTADLDWAIRRCSGAADA